MGICIDKWHGNYWTFTVYIGRFMLSIDRNGIDFCNYFGIGGG